MLCLINSPHLLYNILNQHTGHNILACSWINTLYLFFGLDYLSSNQILGLDFGLDFFSINCLPLTLDRDWLWLGLRLIVGLGP